MCRHEIKNYRATQGCDPRSEGRPADANLKRTSKGGETAMGLHPSPFLIFGSETNRTRPDKTPNGKRRNQRTNEDAPRGGSGNAAFVKPFSRIHQGGMVRRALPREKHFKIRSIRDKVRRTNFGSCCFHSNVLHPSFSFTPDFFASSSKPNRRKCRSSVLRSNGNRPLLLMCVLIASRALTDSGPMVVVYRTFIVVSVARCATCVKEFICVSCFFKHF